MTTNREKLSDDERRKSWEAHRSGEYIRHKLIRFGYLSVAERRRLIEKYGDLEERFELGLDSETKLQILVLAYFAYVLGLGIGTVLAEPGQSGWAVVIGFAVAIIMYWVFALWYLNASGKAEKERKERFPVLNKSLGGYVDLLEPDNWHPVWRQQLTLHCASRKGPKF